ncbi:MAG: BtrH N-terminal domain-containing protein [Gammaproteobacteria bacterium]|nr:BtrH N-terminal domain-containing protein [Gammaproteobacteria bacterium]
MTEEFIHTPSAHCETGTVSNLLRSYGLEISEPMVFGLGSGMTFAYLKQIKINGLPLIAYRMPPKMIIKLLTWRISGLKFHYETFRNADKGMLALDEKLTQGNAVGLQTSVFFLPYFPQAMRFHFNAHNLVAYGKENNEYKISDPVFSHLVTTTADDLQRARFSKGALAPKGLMYYPSEVPDSIDYDLVIPKSIRFMAKMNGRWNPVPFSGIKGMRLLAKNIARFDNADQHYAQLFMGHIVRMQEEIGTGGAGFRFIYAAFLQESANLIDSSFLHERSTEMTQIGDEWRDFAVLCARLSKKRKGQEYSDAAKQLNKIADMELDFYQRLSKFKK